MKSIDISGDSLVDFGKSSSGEICPRLLLIYGYLMDRWSVLRSMRQILSGKQEAEVHFNQDSGKTYVLMRSDKDKINSESLRLHLSITTMYATVECHEIKEDSTWQSLVEIFNDVTDE